VHKSRLGAIIIDCETDVDAAAEFWSLALGRDVQRRFEPGDEHYRGLTSPPTEPKLLLQRVNHPSRVHLDIETDDIEAEVERLVGLGAKRVEKIRDWWVLEAPTGHRFCVVGPQRPDFDTEATAWGDP